MSAAFMIGPWLATAPLITYRRPGFSTALVRLCDTRSPMESCSPSDAPSSLKSSSVIPPTPTSNSSTYIYLSFVGTSIGLGIASLSLRSVDGSIPGPHSPAGPAHSSG
jgi:hypothetical protein